MGNWLLPGPPGHQFPEPSQESAVLLPGGEADAESSQLRARKEARGQPASHHSPRAVPCTPADVCTEFSTSATVHSTTLAFQVLWLHAPHVVQGHLFIWPNVSVPRTLHPTCPETPTCFLACTRLSLCGLCTESHIHPHLSISACGCQSPC